MASFNQVTLIGNLGADPEIKTLNSGDRVCNLRVACSEKWRDKGSGQMKERTEWVRVTIFNDGLIKIAEQYLSKGKQVMLQGKLQTRKWTDNNNIERYSTEVVLQNFGGTMVLLGGGKDREDSGRSGYGGGGYADGDSGGQDQRGNPRQDFSADLDDEIPF